MKRLMVLALLIVVSGCSVVLSGSPMGTQVQRADPSKWDGVWANLETGNEETMSVRVVDADAGMLQIEYVDRATPVQRRVFLRGWGSWTFLSVACEEDPGNECFDRRGRYLWVACEMRDDVLVIWVAGAAQFGELVDQGQLPGEKIGSSVELFPLEDHHYQLITADEHADLWSWRDPFLLRRIVRN